MQEITSLADTARVVYRGSQGTDSKIVIYNPRKRLEILEITCFADVVRVVYWSHKASKSSQDPKIMGYNPRKRPEMVENTSFADPARVVYRGATGHRNPPGTQKSWVITHENGQKWPKT